MAALREYGLAFASTGRMPERCSASALLGLDVGRALGLRTTENGECSWTTMMQFDIINYVACSPALAFASTGRMGLRSVPSGMKSSVTKSLTMAS